MSTTPNPHPTDPATAHPGTAVQVSSPDVQPGHLDTAQRSQEGSGVQPSSRPGRNLQAPLQAPPGAGLRGRRTGLGRRVALYADVLGALALSWSGQSAAVQPLLGFAMALAFAATIDLAAVLALHEAVSSPVPGVRRWAWAVLILAGGTSLGLNVFHAIHSGLLPGLVAVAVGAVPVLIAGILSHVVALSGEAVHQLAVGPAREPVPGLTAEPPVNEPAAAPAHHPTHEPAPEPAQQPSTDPASEPANEPAGESQHRSLHVVREPARRPRATPAAAGSRTTHRATEDQPDGEQVAAEFWRTEIAAGRMPSGGELARQAGVSRATGKRWARNWRAELNPTDKAADRAADNDQGDADHDEAMTATA